MYVWLLVIVWALNGTAPMVDTRIDNIGSFQECQELSQSIAKSVPNTLLGPQVAVPNYISCRRHAYGE